MKSLNRQQLFFLGFGLLVVIGASAVGWLGLNSSSSIDENLQTITTNLNDEAIAGILAKSDGVDKALRDAVEITKLKSQLGENCEKATKTWIESTKQAQGDGKDWSQDPGKWKDRLISIQSQIQKDAASNRLTLSPEFYLGLESFRQKSPTPEEVPDLALDLSLAQRLVEKLMESRRESREQYPTPCELRQVVFPGLDQITLGANSPTSVSKETANEALRRKIRLEFLSSPEVLYDFVHRISSDDWLWVIHDLAIVNPKQTFLSRTEIAKGLTATGTTSTNQAKLLELLAGGEALNIQMDLEYILWTENGNTNKTSEVPKEKKP